MDLCYILVISACSPISFQTLSIEFRECSVQIKDEINSIFMVCNSSKYGIRTYY